MEQFLRGQIVSIDGPITPDADGQTEKRIGRMRKANLQRIIWRTDN